MYIGCFKRKIIVDDVFKYTGIEKKAKMTLGELTVWLFHDLQANALANEK